MIKYLENFYIEHLYNKDLANILAMITLISIFIVIFIILYLTLSKFLKIVSEIFFVKKNDFLKELLIVNNVYSRISRVLIAIFIYYYFDNIYINLEHSFIYSLIDIIHRLINIYIVISLSLLIIAICNSLSNYLNNLPNFKHISFRSYKQLLKIIIFLIATIVIISQILNKSPTFFLTGLGALSAVLILVFKDTIMGFVTNIQVSVFDLVRVGDWITISAMNIDGNVEDISINSIKIRNFDKTVSIIPTYSLINNNVQNWRGMVETGGRRIKRSINIDMNTIKFCKDSLLEKLSQNIYLKDFIKENKNIELTNIKLFRIYVENYLAANPKIRNKDLTFLVRELQPTENGLPVELYIFANSTNWVIYEKIQADIIDYVLASMPLFELRPFQATTDNFSFNSNKQN